MQPTQRRSLKQSAVVAARRVAPPQGPAGASASQADDDTDRTGLGKAAYAAAIARCADHRLGWRRRMNLDVAQWLQRQASVKQVWLRPAALARYSASSACASKAANGGDPALACTAPALKRNG